MDQHEPTLLTIVSNGGSAFDKVWTPSEYRIRPLPATRELAIAHVVRRLGLSRALAAVVAELAGLGGRHQ